MASYIARRKFLAALLGSAAAAWPLAASAQQQTMPIVGFLGAPSAAAYARYVAAVQQGLKEAGYIEGQNVRFEYRRADGHYDRLPGLAADLVNRGVSVIIPIGGSPPTVAAKEVTITVPIVSNMGGDPIKLGLVASLNRPGGNVTGIAMLAVELGAKQFELLHELVPTAALVAILVNPNNPQAGTQLEDMRKAARTIGQRILVLNASTGYELERSFETLAHERADALLVAADVFFASQPTLLVVLTARHAIPAMYPWRSHVDAGGLMSYGASLLDAYRQTGVYAGRVVGGEKPADLPVLQSTKFELVINLKTARAIGLTIPSTLLALADEVIE